MEIMTNRNVTINHCKFLRFGDMTITLINTQHVNEFNDSNEIFDRLNKMLIFYFPIF